MRRSARLKKKKRTLTAQGEAKLRLAGLHDWVFKATGIHGDKYDYTNVPKTFQTQKKPPVAVFCKTHELRFKVLPFNHIRSKSGGCRQCDEVLSVRYLRDRESKKFSAWFEKTRSSALEMVSEFQGMTVKMKFRCKEHDIITSAKPTDLMHRAGHGCVHCARENAAKTSRLTYARVGEDLSEGLPDNIQIVAVYFDEKKKQSVIKINCQYHGESVLSKGALQRSNLKCQACGKETIGYAGYRLKRLVEAGSSGSPTFLGVMEVEAFGIRSLKVGVTTRSLEKRYAWNLKTIHFSAQMRERDAYVLENQIHRKFKDGHDQRIFKAGLRQGQRWSGDTECYFKRHKDEIVHFIQDYLSGTKAIDYASELEMFEVPDFIPRDVSRAKNKRNGPVSVVGVDPRTNEVIHEFDSISMARRTGFTNISLTLSDKYGRQLFGGLRWFRKLEFYSDNIPRLKPSRRGKPVQCIETGQVYNSAIEATEKLRAIGKRINSSHISSVCNGKRKKAGGFVWKHA